MKDTIKFTLIWLVPIFIFKSCLLNFNAIVSESMAPNLSTNDVVIVNKFAFGLRVPLTNLYLIKSTPPKVGETVIFQGPDNIKTHNWVKRVIAVGGDRIAIKNKQIYINSILRPCQPTSGNNCIEMSAHTKYDIAWDNVSNDEQAINMPELVIPKDHVFLMGDNRSHSYDSRYFGPIHIDLIHGKQLIKIPSAALVLDFLFYALIAYLLLYTVKQAVNRFTIKEEKND